VLFAVRGVVCTKSVFVRGGGREERGGGVRGIGVGGSGGTFCRDGGGGGGSGVCVMFLLGNETFDSR